MPHPSCRLQQARWLNAVRAGTTPSLPGAVLHFIPLRYFLLYGLDKSGLHPVD
ncbi:hypothetical protein [cf. Phormidesmis sp. LEGE 11477]|uniref:hypothetical protein n=1 Tax=cf. Phormidesmis sp. LEGE 11477 TaxID=1828680 RepID=UPI001880570D|nr:hypothetical protein [cf. Phormidesmis sp. LEGE 11477]MBE9064978.1 hypothetical protein [cf. Phormidesmis sp. LEGE 11477]